MFALAFTKKRPGQVKKTAYARSSQVRLIRRKMVEIMTREASSCDLKDLVAKFIPEAIGKDIEKACQGVYPLQNVAVRKVKVLKAPKLDVTKLMEVHGDYAAEDAAAAAAAAAKAVERPAAEAEAAPEAEAAE